MNEDRVVYLKKVFGVLLGLAVGVALGALSLPKSESDAAIVDGSISSPEGSVISIIGRTQEGSGIETFRTRIDRLLSEGVDPKAIKAEAMAICVEWMEEDPLACARWLATCPEEFREPQVLWEAAGKAAVDHYEAAVDLAEGLDGYGIKLNVLSRILLYASKSDPEKLWRDLPDLMDRFRFEQSNRDHYTSYVLKQWAEHEPRTALEELSKNTLLSDNAWRQLGVEGHAFSVWRDKDPEGAQEWLDSLPLVKQISVGGEAVKMLSRTDPEAAIDLAVTLPRSQRRMEVLTEAVTALLRTDSTKALTRLDSIGDPELRNHLTHELAPRFVLGESKEMEEFIGQVESPSERHSLWRSMSSNLSVNSPQEAWNTAATLEDPEGRLIVRLDAVNKASERSPVTAAEMISGTTDSLERRRLYAEIVGRVEGPKQLAEVMAVLGNDAAAEFRDVWERSRR